MCIRDRLNTTPTLAGLAYAIEEFDRRVFVGLEPPALARMRKNPERFIERIRVGSEKEDRDPVSYTHLDVYKRQSPQHVWGDIAKIVESGGPVGVPWDERSNTCLLYTSRCV